MFPDPPFDTTYLADITAYAVSDDMYPIRRTIFPNITISQEEMNKMKEPEKQKETKTIYIDRYDRNDRIIVPLSRLEVRDTFRVVDDEKRNVYIVVDLKDVIDISTTDPTTVYAINMATAEVVPFDENTQVYVYDPDGVQFKVREFIKGEVK